MLGGWLALGVGSLGAADFTVDSTADTGDANKGDATCDSGAGHCTLRAAIEEANALSGSDTIHLPAGTFSIGDPLTVTAGSTINILGAGELSTILDGGGDRRVFEVTDGTLWADNLTIRNGAGATAGEHGGNINLVGSASLRLFSCTLSGGQASGGGGIHAPTGTSVNLIDTTVSGNHATSSHGGALEASGAQVDMSLCTITDNTAGEAGGAVYVSSSSHVSIDFTTIANNQAMTSTGGGVYSGNSLLTLSDSTIRGNSALAGGGGGLYLYDNIGTTATIERCAIADNSAATKGGGILVAVNSGAVDIVDSTISGNSADLDGGGLYVLHSARTTLSNCTVSDNTADADGTAQPGDGDGGGFFAYDNGAEGGLLLRNTVVAGNHDGSVGLLALFAPDCAVRSGVTVASEGHDFIGHATSLCAVSGAQTGDQVGWYAAIDPKLGALTDGGYGTYYHPPLALSPLIDMGDPAGCRDQAGALLGTDQRGETRPYAATPCDIGAVESSLSGLYIFANGFENGNTTTWSSTAP